MQRAGWRGTHLDAAKSRGSSPCLVAKARHLGVVKQPRETSQDFVASAFWQMVPIVGHLGTVGDWNEQEDSVRGFWSENDL